MDYWHKRYTCPYFTSSEKRRVCCEGGSRVSFETGGAASRFMSQFCAGTSTNERRKRMGNRRIAEGVGGGA